MMSFFLELLKGIAFHGDFRLLGFRCRYRAELSRSTSFSFLLCQYSSPAPTSARGCHSLRVLEAALKSNLKTTSSGKFS